MKDNNKIILRKDFFERLVEAARHSAFRTREFDEDMIHDQTRKDGFTVVEGGVCNNPDCVICELDKLVAEADRKLEEDHQWGLPIDSLSAQTSLLGALADKLQEHFHYERRGGV